MSLINQMLSDLERRSAAARPAALDAQIRAVPRPRRRWSGKVVVLAAGLMAGAAMTSYWTRQVPGRAEEAAARPSQPSTAAAQVIEAPQPSLEPALPSPRSEPLEGEAQEAIAEAAARPAEALLPTALATSPAPGAEEGAGAPASRAGGEARWGAVPSGKASAPGVSREDAKAAPRTPGLAAVAPSAGSTAASGDGSSSSAPGPERTGAEPPLPTPLSIDKKPRPLTPEEQAENAFRRGLAALQRHRDREAMDAFRAALELNSRHETARQSLVALLLADNRLAEAEKTLAEGLALNPRQIGFATALARIQVERGASATALDTLAAVAPHAGDSAQFEAFFAALLHRAGRHREAVERYSRALQLAPGTGVWLLGMGLALQADGRSAEARAAFEQARASRQLSAELAAFVEERLGEWSSN